MSSNITIFFLRHGRSLGDDTGVHEGDFDTPLTARGREQAERRAQIWQTRHITFDRILSSPLQRAQETAEILANMLGIPVELDSLWMEMDNGPLAGLSYADAEQRYPWPTFRNPYEPFFETGESTWEIQSRSTRAVEMVIRRGPGRYLVVTHGGILNAALRHILGASPPLHGHGVWFEIADTGYVQTSYAPDRHQWIVHAFDPGEISDG
jgi:2,3-bisphosphoglycerate-dependent phosphoglycerate mutase